MAASPTGAGLVRVTSGLLSPVVQWAGQSWHMGELSPEALWRWGLELEVRHCPGVKPEVKTLGPTGGTCLCHGGAGGMSRVPPQRPRTSGGKRRPCQGGPRPLAASGCPLSSHVARPAGGLRGRKPQLPQGKDTSALVAPVACPDRLEAPSRTDTCPGSHGQCWAPLGDCPALLESLCVAPTPPLLTRSSSRWVRWTSACRGGAAAQGACPICQEPEQALPTGPGGLILLHGDFQVAGPELGSLESHRWSTGGVGVACLAWAREEGGAVPAPPPRVSAETLVASRVPGSRNPVFCAGLLGSLGPRAVPRPSERGCSVRPPGSWEPEAHPGPPSRRAGAGLCQAVLVCRAPGRPCKARNRPLLPGAPGLPPLGPSWVWVKGGWA